METSSNLVGKIVAVQEIEDFEVRRNGNFLYAESFKSLMVMNGEGSNVAELRKLQLNIFTSTQNLSNEIS